MIITNILSSLNLAEDDIGIVFRGKFTNVKVNGSAKSCLFTP